MNLKPLEDSLQLKLTSVVTTNQLSYYASFYNGLINTQNSGFTKNTDTISIAPKSTNKSSITQYIEYIIINNLDTIDQEIIVSINGTIPIIKITLESGSGVEYNNGSGWNLLNLNGPE